MLMVRWPGPNLGLLAFRKGLEGEEVAMLVSNCSAAMLVYGLAVSVVDMGTFYYDMVRYLVWPTSDEYLNEVSML